MLDGSNRARHLAVDDTHVYFLQEYAACSRSTCVAEASLRRVSRCGGPAEDIGNRQTIWLSRIERDQPSRLAAGGGHVYVLTRSLARVNAADKTLVDLGLPDGCASSVVAGADHVYVYDRCQQQILRGKHSDTALERFAVAGEGRLLALTAQALYFDRGSEIWWQDLQSSAGGLLYTSTTSLLDFAADDETLVLEEDPQAPRLKLVPLGGGAPRDLGFGSPPQPSVSLVGSPESVFMAGGHAYFRHLGRYGVLDISRTPVGGGATVPVLRRDFADFTVQGDRVYWAEGTGSGGGGLYTTRLPQPPVPAGPDADKPPIWARRYGLSHDTPAVDEEHFYDVRLLSDGSAVVIGSAGPLGTDLGTGPITAVDEFIAKLSEAGDVVWSAQITPAETTGASCLAVAPDQTIVVAGVDSSSDPFSAEPHILGIHRYSPDGTLRGETRESGKDWWLPVCNVDPRGNLFLFSSRGVLARKGPDGADVWRKSLRSPDSTAQLFPVNLAVSPATDPPGFAVAFSLYGSMEIGGVTYDSGSEPDYAPLAYLTLRVLDDGSIAWVNTIRGGLVDRVALDASGRVLVLGTTSRALDVGNGPASVPRPGEIFSYLLWLDPQGAVESLRFLDGEAFDVALGPDGSLYLLAGYPRRPFYFDPPYAPGNYDYGVLWAKLDRFGQLVETRNLSSHLVTGASKGDYMAEGRIAVGADRAVVAGTVRATSAPVTVPHIWDGFAARFDP